MKQHDTADQAEPVTRPLVSSTEICPYCHLSLDEENGGCRLTHEHGKHHMPREPRLTYAELEERLAQAERERATAVDCFVRAAEDLMPLRRERPWLLGALRALLEIHDTAARPRKAASVRHAARQMLSYAERERSAVQP